MFQHSRFVVQVLEFSLKHIGSDGMPLVGGSFGIGCYRLLVVCSTKLTLNHKQNSVKDYVMLTGERRLTGKRQCEEGKTTNDHSRSIC